MPQIFPDSSSASPTIQNLAPSGTQFATNAVAMRPPASSFSRTGTTRSKGRNSRTPEPSVLTTSVWHCSENWMAGSRLVRRRGICARMRVLRRSASYDLALDSMLRCQNFTSEMLPNWNSSAQKWHQSNHGAVTQNYCLNARLLKAVQVAQRDGRKPAKYRDAKAHPQTFLHHAGLLLDQPQIHYIPYGSRFRTTECVRPQPARLLSLLRLA